MAEFIVSKVLDALPDELTPSTLYFVRNGPGFDIYLTDKHTPATATRLNDTVVGEVDIQDWWDNSSAKTKLDGVATGATKNATDDQLRDRTAHTGTQAISTVSGLQDTLNTKANTSAQVIAGTGLSGGGNLTANITLSVNYGTSAGTAAQGNDSRINNGQTAFGWGNHASAGYVNANFVVNRVANIPSVPTSTPYTVVGGDKGKSIDTSANVTIPPNVFAVGDTLVVTNTTAGEVRVIPGAGVTIRHAGTEDSGIDVLDSYGVTTLRMVTNNNWRAIGVGMSI